MLVAQDCSKLQRNACDAWKHTLGQSWQSDGSGVALSLQAAKTYLERKFEELATADVDALLQHALKVRGVHRLPMCMLTVTMSATFADRPGVAVLRSLA